MVFHLKLGFLVLAVTYKLDNVQGDPCTTYLPIPDIDRRGPLFSLSSGEEPINDRELFEGWYGDVMFKLVDEAPGSFTCGGWYPMWRRGTDNTSQLSEMCVQDNTDNCSETFDIETEICNGFEVYYLLKAPIHRASYCFAINPDAPPSFDMTPIVTVDLHHEKNVSKLLFRCNVSQSLEDLLYKTTWYVNGAPVYTFGPSNWTNGTDDYIIASTLTEQILMENGVKKAGINVQCAVRAKYDIEGASSKSQLSYNQFVGVKIHHWASNTMAEGETRKLYVAMTVPFGCGTDLKSKGQPCHFNLEVVTVENHEDCKLAAVVENSCGIEPFKAENWSDPSSLTFVGKMTSMYGENTGTTHLKLKTPTNARQLTSFWKDYDIGHISIQILKNTSSRNYKYCSIVNDPYMKTFDRARFALNNTGVYTLYQDKSKSIEVQVETEICSPVDLWGRSNPYCNCGFVVRAGRTVFEISHCDSPIWHIGYSACEDGGDVLIVRRNWNYYTITLPTGVLIDVDVRDGGVKHLNVNLYPSALDEGKSRGMCGVLSSTPVDDLIMANEQLTHSTEQFAESWRISKDKSLFNPDVVQSDLSSYKPVYQYCTCDESPSDKTITCSAMAASDVCKSPVGFKDIKPRDCVISKRKKRMARTGPKRFKRSTTENTWTNGWNESAATAYCESMFAESPSVQLVKDVPGVDINSSMKDCIADIKASGTSAFAAAAVAGVATKATREAMVNPVLTQPDPNNPSAPIVFDVITRQTCASDCSGRGTCLNGRCQCNRGYGGGDCSVDLTTPPEIADVGDGSSCDLSVKDCLQTTVLGKIFSGSEDSECLITKHTVQSSGTKTRTAKTSSLSSFESISEVDCTLPALAEDDVVVSFNVAVSHSGDVFSNELSIFVYDSTCVNVDHDTGDWTMQDGFCVYRGRCFAVDSLRSDNPCVRCVTHDAEAKWELSKENGCPDGNLQIGEADNSSSMNIQTFIVTIIPVVILQTLV